MLSDKYSFDEILGNGEPKYAQPMHLLKLRNNITKITKEICKATLPNDVDNIIKNVIQGPDLGDVYKSVNNNFDLFLNL